MELIEISQVQELNIFNTIGLRNPTKSDAIRRMLVCASLYVSRFTFDRTYARSWTYIYIHMYTMKDVYTYAHRLHMYMYINIHMYTKYI